MILGVKCEGCKMWTRITDTGRMDLAYKCMSSIEPYYCDECLANVTYHVTKARIEL